MNEAIEEIMSGNMDIGDTTEGHDDMLASALAPIAGVIDPAKGHMGPWPQFVEGEEVVVKGVLFDVLRVNATNIVIKPHVNFGQSARVVMAKLGKRK